VSERKAGTVRENVSISHRGASYEIGRGPGFYGIWPTAAPDQPQPIEWWPQTPEGWQAAWSRFTSVEPPGGIAPAAQQPIPAQQPSPAQPAATAAQHPIPAAVGTSTRRGAVIAAAALLVIGVAVGIAGLFPSYVAGASLAQQPPELVPHAIYLAAWAASGVLILLGGARLQAGALLALGTSVITFGFFFVDAGTVMSGGSRLLGAGLVLSLIGWLACAAGSVLAFMVRPGGRTAGPRGHEAKLTLTLAGLAAVGTVVAFAPSWDSFTLRVSTGASQTLTQGNAFANPAPVIAGEVAVMVAVLAVVIAAALWRPPRLGAALIAGAIIPLAAQAISALIGAGEPASSLQFGISPAQAALVGLTISSGVTATFWVYCAFIIALMLTCAMMLTTAAPQAGFASQDRAAPPAPSREALLDAVPPAASTLS
jgi:hypothetical protein